MAYATPTITDKNTVTEILLDMIRLALGTGTLALGASEAHIGEVGGNLSYIGVEFTRPANTTAYTALDVVSDSVTNPSAINFTPLARVASGTGYIVKALLFTDQKTCTARFRLHLFHTSPTPIIDNTPYLLLYTNRTIKIGSIDFVACATEDPTSSTGASSAVFDCRIPYKCADSFRNIYGVLETLDAFTPASAQKFHIELTSDNN